MNRHLLIQNGELINPGGRSGRLDIRIRDGVVAQIGPALPPDGAEILDATGLTVLPGLVDIHCHLREPGFEYKEDIASGTLAAAHGGFTAVCPMPNTSPVTDSAAQVEWVIRRAREAGFAKVYPIAAITKGLKGEELAEAGELKAAGAVGLSDDGKPVERAAMMRRALQYAGMFNLTVISHCEDLTLADGFMNEGRVATQLGLKGIPAAAEEIMVAREILLAEGLHAKVHIAHISTRGSVALIRDAKARGVRVSAETCPHYFSGTEALALDFNANAKVNPPLRAQEDVDAIIGGLIDGTIDAIATDHAPHHEDDKLCEFALASNGLSGFDAAFSLGVTYLVQPGHLPLHQLVSLMSVQPARLLGLPAGILAEGSPADIAVADIAAEYTLQKEHLFSKGKNTPFLGAPLRGKILHTLLDGRFIIRNTQKEAKA